MDLTFSEADEQFRTEFRAWLADNLPTEWRQRGFWRSQGDAGFEMRRTWEADKAKAGFAGIQWPKEFGGRGGTNSMRAIYDEEMVRHRAPMTVNSLGLTFLAPTIMKIGTDEQKRDIIKPMLHNEVIWCQGFSEPGAGSDLAALSPLRRQVVGQPGPELGAELLVRLAEGEVHARLPVVSVA